MAVVLVVTGCATAGVSNPPPSPLPASPSRAATTPQPSPLIPSPAASIGGLDARSVMDAVVEDLMAAIGNPDTGSSSEAMTAFEAAITAGDAARIRSTADVVLGHLAAGRERLASFGGPGCDSFCPEWQAMLGEIGTAVTTMRDSATAGTLAAVETGRSAIQVALLDHFWQGLRGDDPDLYVRTLRDGRRVDASRMRWSTEPSAAFDGNPDSAWTTGDAAAPQWIEVDFGSPTTVRSVRLLTMQDRAGPSDHLITACGADGVERELVRLTGETKDREWLEHVAATPVGGVRVVRVTTLATPSAIGWREIEIRVPAGSTPDPSPPATICGSRDLAVDAAAAGEPAEPGREPALAIDGDPDTGWGVGERCSLHVTLAAMAEVFEVRLLLDGSAGAAAEYSVVATTGGNQLLLVGRVSGSSEVGAWRSIVNASPSMMFREFDLHVRGEAPAARILEIQIIGSPRG